MKQKGKAKLFGPDGKMIDLGEVTIEYKTTALQFVSVEMIEATKKLQQELSLQILRVSHDLMQDDIQLAMLGVIPLTLENFDRLARRPDLKLDLVAGHFRRK